MFVGIAMMRFYLEDEGNPNSSFRQVLDFLRFSGGNLGLVQIVKLTLLGYTTVTFWSWTGVVKMSTFTVRTPGQTGNG